MQQHDKSCIPTKLIPPHSHHH